MTKTIAVIDGNSLMHRAYHAIQTPMEALDGTPTNAVFGFLQMFCKFVEIASPDAVICAFDKGKPTNRIEELPEYKAQRPHMDEELRVQFPVAEELLGAMNVPVITVLGWEGDDILGTIAARDEKLGYRTLLVTGDKDACQLASSLTSVVNTKKGISEVVILDPEGVTEKYGVTPDQFTDFLGLMGDTSDNIPGIPGIGPKTAATMLQKYGNIEGIYEHIDEFKGKQKEKLEQNEKLAYLSRDIATIMRDLDFEVDLEGVSFPDFDPAKVEAAFKKYSLMSPLRRVLNLVDARPETTLAKIDVPKILKGKTAKTFVEEVKASKQCLGVAFSEGAQETIFGTAIKCAISDGKTSVILEDDDAVSVLGDLLESGLVACLDLKATSQIVYPADSSKPTSFDTSSLHTGNFDIGLAAYLLDSSASTYDCNSICKKYLGLELPEENDEDSDLATEAMVCALAPDPLRAALEKDSSTSVYTDIDFPLVSVLAKMERTGAEIDVDRLSVLGEYASERLSDLTCKIFDIAGEEFNIDSPKQLGHILFEVLGISPLKKTTRGYSTDATVMRELAKEHEIASLVLSYRELSKIKSTYIDTLPNMRGGDGRLHTNFHETVTATGRLSSSSPNLQNIPVRTDFGRKIRECFVPLSKNDVFVSADYSQIELRLLAHLSGDENLISAFKSGADFHAMTASRVYGVPIDEVSPQMRSHSKAVNFGIVYGQQAFGLAQSLDISRKEAKEMIDRYFDAYPTVRTYLDGIVAQAKELGYAQTLFGRKRRVPELKSRNRNLYGLGERIAMNHPMQGTAADIIKLAMIEVQRQLEEGGFASKLMLQVHDELDLSVPKEELESVSAMIKDVMEGVVKLKVPLTVEVSSGSNWAEAH